jgi:hypothetical protein
VRSLTDSLNRTLLLIRDEVGPEVDDRVLLEALTSTRVVLIADAANLAPPTAQTTFVTAALLMARSGHQVFLVAPDVVMAAPQPPLSPGPMISRLTQVGSDMLPGVEFFAGEPNTEVELAICLGDSSFHNVTAKRRIRLNAEPWAGIIMRQNQLRRWQANLWPMGALAAAALAAGEAFKIVMHKLLPYTLSPAETAERFAETAEIAFELAPPDTPFCFELGRVDFVSGGAITNAVLYCLARIPTIRAQGRIIEPEAPELSNLNRYMLLLSSHCQMLKAAGLTRMLEATLQFQPITKRYEPRLLEEIGPLAPTVVVGVDHIATRWAVQEAMPEWLVIGATTHWSAMASFHSDGLACARCLHSRDDTADGPLPTTACVSFWAGLLTTSYLVRHAAGQVIHPREQQVYLTPFRPESAFRSGVAMRQNCPTCYRPAGHTTVTGRTTA